MGSGCAYELAAAGSSAAGASSATLPLRTDGSDTSCAVFLAYHAA